tara:strand:+ start:149 stop:703 length:555 start_codon:yes stop_codon:yes gene_type:complete
MAINFSSAKYYPDVAAGGVFIGSTAAAGTALPAAGGTAMTFGLWNNTSNKNAVLIGFAASYVSGTITVAGFGLTIIPNAGVSIASGGPISAFTAGTPTNALVNAGSASSMLFTPSAATIVAGTRYQFTGVGHEIATAGPGMNTGFQDFNGIPILSPGSAAFVTGSIAQTGLFAMTLIWSEIASS